MSLELQDLDYAPPAPASWKYAVRQKEPFLSTNTWHPKAPASEESWKAFTEALDPLIAKIALLDGWQWPPPGKENATDELGLMLSASP
jgi:hypothetical protein